MIRDFDASDLKQINLWCELRGLKELHLDDLPENGFVVPGVAAGFLYKTDSRIAIIEFLITNPNEELFKRKEAVDLVIDTLVNKAKEMGFRVVYGFTSEKKVKSLALRHGFVSGQEYQMIYKEI